jgi:RimJ/RimL family protein N-acetyltransferase
MRNPHWPLLDVRVVTPVLELAPLDDERCVELATLAARGVHDPATMPFAVPWTDQPSPTLEREALRYWWTCRAEARPAAWNLNLAVVVDGKVVGASGLNTHEFAVTRSFETGSWLGREHQGRGLGTGVRLATLALGFDGFGAEEATTSAFRDNPASLGVTRKLGYERNGVVRNERRGAMAETLRFRMARAQWDTIRPSGIELHGVAGARDFLGC